MGQLASVPHRLLLGVKNAGGQLMWFHALSRFDNSCVLVRHGRLLFLSGTRHRVFLHDAEAGKLVLLPIFSLGDISACTVEWKSWARTCRQPGLTPSSTLAQVLAWVVKGPATALEVAAQCCFWGMRRNQVEQYARLQGAVIHEGATFLDVLKISVMAMLPNLTQQELLEVLSTHMTENDVSASFAESLLEIDEAAELLERNDAQVPRKEAKKARRPFAVMGGGAMPPPPYAHQLPVVPQRGGRSNA